MSEDKRAEAMRRAIEESDAERKKTPTSSGKSTGNPQLDQAKAVAAKGVTEGKKQLKKLWGTKTGKLAAGAAAGVLGLVILASIISGVMGKASSAPITYEVSDAILCAYETEDSTSGYAYDAYVEITNTGSENIYVKDMTFMIQDGEGSRVMLDNSISAFPAIIAPGEKGYVFNNFGTELTGVYDPEMELYLVPQYTVMRAEAAPRSYPVENVRIEKGMNGQKMVGQVVNDSGDPIDSAYVVGVTYNADGHCTSISGTFLQNIEPHVSVNVQFDPINSIRAWANEEVVDYMIYAY